MATVDAGFEDRDGEVWGYYHVILPGGKRMDGYAIVDLVDDMGLVQVANHFGFAPKYYVEEMYGPLRYFHN